MEEIKAFSIVWHRYSEDYWFNFPLFGWVLEAPSKGGRCKFGLRVYRRKGRYAVLTLPWWFTKLMGA